MRILLVEDDSRVASFVRRGLREEQYAVDMATDGEKALFMTQTAEYDLIILDLMLPKKDGMEVLRTLRGSKCGTPVLILTAKDKPKDKVEGLNAGADDYLTKPFGFEELLARVRALLRRRGDMIPTVLTAGDLQMDTMKHKVRRGGKEIDLTNREYALMEFFLRHPNEVVTRTTLSEQVWEADFDTFSNVIDVHIARLRQKINDGFSSKFLETVRGRGYILQISEIE
jgi:DNA-binding response OmpR family regulator